MRNRLALLVLLSGCGGSSGVGGGGGDAGPYPDFATAPDLAVDPDRACTDTATAFCGRINDCAPGLVAQAYGDVPTCITRALIGCKAGFTLPGTSASPARAETCAGELAGVSCDDLVNHKLPTHCVTLPGMLQNGAACADDAQCVSAVCVHPIAGGCGTCGTPPKAGESCATLECAAGLSCGSTNAICAAYGTLNSVCDANHPCLPTLACKGTNKMGTCVSPLPLMSACDPMQAQYSGCWIAHGQYCAPAGTCQPLTFAKAGDACGLLMNFTTYVVCAGSGHCTAPSLFVPGACLKFADDGAACSTQNGPDCMPPAHCTGGLCKLIDPASCK